MSKDLRETDLELGICRERVRVQGVEELRWRWMGRDCGMLERCGGGLICTGDTGVCHGSARLVENGLSRAVD